MVTIVVVVVLVRVGVIELGVGVSSRVGVGGVVCPFVPSET
jgi:hypothetical protein